MADFNPLRIRCMKILPSVYDDSLSYYEYLCKVNQVLNELIEYINQFDYSEIQAQLDNFKQYIDSQIALEDNKIASLRSDYNQFKQDVNTQVIGLATRIDTFEAQLAANAAAARKYADEAIAANNDYLFEQIDEQLIDVKVINYFTGAKVSVQEMFDYLAQFHLTNAINYAQMATREKTYNQFAALNITYTQLAVDGASLFV